MFLCILFWSGFFCEFVKVWSFLLTITYPCASCLWPAFSLPELKLDSNETNLTKMKQQLADQKRDADSNQRKVGVSSNLWLKMRSNRDTDIVTLTFCLCTANNRNRTSNKFGTAIGAS